MDIRIWKLQDKEGLEVDTFAVGANIYVREALQIVKARLMTPDVRKYGI